MTTDPAITRILNTASLLREIGGCLLKLPTYCGPANDALRAAGFQMQARANELEDEAEEMSR